MITLIHFVLLLARRLYIFDAVLAHISSIIDSSSKRCFFEINAFSVFCMSVTEAGIVNSEGMKVDITKDLIQHAKLHYKAYDETKLMTRLDKMDGQEIEDLANDQDAFHHFFITTTRQSKRNLYGLGEHGSNMKRYYKITTEMNVTFDLNTMRQIISRMIEESVG